jgi:hypothetical protein
MAIFLRYAVYTALILLFPLTASAETWVEFHSEKWNYKSQKVKKKLNFKNRFYYEADSLKRSAAGEVDVWVKEVSMNDRYYVGKGTPSSEEILKLMHFWCAAGKYEIIVANEEDAGTNEALGEEVKTGSLYDRLFNIVCDSNKKN